MGGGGERKEALAEEEEGGGAGKFWWRKGRSLQRRQQEGTAEFLAARRPFRILLDASQSGTEERRKSLFLSEDRERSAIRHRCLTSGTLDGRLRPLAPFKALGGVDLFKSP